MERSFVFENFRNVGFEKEEKLVINHSLEKGKIGNLIVLIGPNNSGKSNVLDGILLLNEKKIDTERNRTTLSFNSKFQTPKISLVTKDENNIYSVTISSNQSNPVFKKPDPKKENLTVAQKKKALTEVCTTIINNCNNYNTRSLGETAKRIKSSITSSSTSEKITEAQKKAVDLLKQIINYQNSYYDYKNVINELSNLSNPIFLETYSSSSQNEKDSAQSQYKNEYKISLMPKILLYTTNEINNSKLNCSYSSLDNNSFMQSLLKSINVSISEIKATYDAYRVHSNKGILKENEKKINKKLKKISDDFNKLYLLEDDAYKFEIDLDSERVFFNIYKNEVALTLDYQSTGFKWFFNLYFNMLCQNTLAPGDIIIMDEPATNLHIGGQEELRKFLKDFAIKNDLIIIIATHLPAFIDLDYLDEIRVVSSIDGKAIIENDFSTINIEDADSLSPIKNALTIRNHMLLDPDKKVVFVEGITDYNYMTAFKKIFNYDDIVFLPIKGVGKTKEDNLKISKRLLEVRKHGAILMADSDEAGKRMKNTNKDSALDVFCLSDVNSNFKTIESLFSDADLKKLGFVDEAGKFIKHSSTSALFKNSILDIHKSLSKTTLDNFENVFKHIDNL